MPAQWPIFINNVSSKLASRSSKGPDDFGMYFANEYFNAVKTSQTPFGNLHSAGQKSVLEQGFKKAFNDLFKSLAPTLEDKIKDDNYSDLLEGLPIPKKYDAEKEFRKWVVSKGDSLPNTKFYEFFPPKPEPETPELTSAEVFGTANEAKQPILNFTGQNGVAPYTFTYTINDGEEIDIISDEMGFAAVYVPFDVPGKIKYTLINVVDSALPDIQHKLNQTVEFNIPKDSTKPAEILNGVEKVKLELTEDQKFELVVKRVLYQNDGDIKFIRFLTRLSLGYERVYGKKVSDECFKILGVTERSTILKQIKDKYADLYKNRKLVVTQETQYALNKQYTFTIEGIRYDSKTTKTSFLKKIDRKIQSQADKAYITLNSNLKTSLTNPLNKKIIQLEYNDDKDILPAWLTDVFICKFCYVEGIDDITEVSHGNANHGNENPRIQAKRNLYKLDKDKHVLLKRQWIDELAITEKKDEDPDDENDPYDTMAKTIISYWKSAAAKPFKNSPPVPPCNVPSPGTYIPLYYGSQRSLAKNLRRAWNTGKLAQLEPLTQPATKAVASAVATCCAKHLAELKFIYVGKLTVGISTVPMIGFVPTSF
jgi:hypothetical protein